MNCKDFQTTAVELARGFPSDLSAREALSHLTDCASCRMKLAEERILTLHLRDASESMSIRGVPESVDKVVFAAFEQYRQGVRTAPPQSFRLKRNRWLAGAGAGLAAALMILIWTYAPVADPPQLLPGSARVPAYEALPSASPAEAESVWVGVPTTETHAAPPVRVSSPAAAVAPPPPAAPEPEVSGTENEAPASDADAFIPIPLGVDPVGTQTGPVVRVEVSGAVLNSLGFPVSGDLYGTRIQADLMIGEDGRAQAIRFVQ